MSRSRSAEVREARLIVLLRDDEKQRVEETAERLGLSVSAYVRSMLLAPGAVRPPPPNEPAEAS